MPEGFIDAPRLKKIRRVQAKYFKRASKIRLTKIKSGRKPFFLTFGVIIIVTFALCLAFFDSKIWAAYRLIQLLKEENVLIGFQNSAELRPTGGFWGSFGIWKIGQSASDSAIIFETNPYKNNNRMLADAKVEPPKPMKETWPENPQGFVNANWSFDFPEAAKTLSWYFAQGWNMEVDGASAISSLAIIDLLKIIGPVYAPDGTEINSSNFTEIMSQKIDTEYWFSTENVETNEPKTILKKIAPQIIDKTKKISKIKLYMFVKDQAEKGRILCYFQDSAKEKLCEKIGIDGKSRAYEVDYLSVNNTNLNGGKTSLNVNQKISYETSRSDGNIISTLQIERSHKAGGWPNILNRNYTRAIVPLGSELIEAKIDDSDFTESIDKYEESGKTVFGFWFSVSPEETKSAKITYKLPVKLDRDKGYKLITQKQPGTLPENIKIQNGDKILYEGIFDQNTKIIK